MDPTPAPIVPKDDTPVTCTPEEAEVRVVQCIPCDNFFIDTDEHSKCRGTGCNISFMTTLNYKSCPKGNW